MCGRYEAAITNLEDLKARFEVQNQLEEDFPLYNVAPGMRMPVITRNSPNSVRMMRWGLIPFWAKDPKIGYKMINARCEGIDKKPSFRKPLASQRCLVPATGFYEWKKDIGDKNKQPYYIHLRGGGIFAFAGLYDIWIDAEGYPLETFTIITTQPNKLMADIHNRMPVILSKGDEEKWLDPTTSVQEAMELLDSYPAKEMEAWQVSKKVNKATNSTSPLNTPINSQ